MSWQSSILEISGRWLLVKKPPEINLESKREQSLFYNLLLLVSHACFLKNAGVSEMSHVYELGGGDVTFQTTNWLGVVNFHCMQMSFVMSTRFIFGDD